MQELKLITNELMPVYETSTGEKVVNARELHEEMNVKSRYNDWIMTRIKKYEFVDEEDFITLTENLVSGGTQKTHILKLDTAKEVAMVENNDRGRKVRKYFIETEKRFNENKTNDLALEIKLNNSRARFVNSALKLLKVDGLSKEDTNAIIDKASKALLGKRIEGKKKKTYSATEIGEKLGISANKVGRLASEHNLKTEQYGEWYKDKCKHSNKEVDSFRYYESAIEFLKSKIKKGDS